MITTPNQAFTGKYDRHGQMKTSGIYVDTYVLTSFSPMSVPRPVPRLLAQTVIHLPVEHGCSCTTALLGGGPGFVDGLKVSSRMSSIPAGRERRIRRRYFWEFRE